MLVIGILVIVLSVVLSHVNPEGFFAGPPKKVSEEESLKKAIDVAKKDIERINKQIEALKKACTGKPNCRIPEFKDFDTKKAALNKLIQDNSKKLTERQGKVKATVLSKPAPRIAKPIRKNVAKKPMAKAKPLAKASAKNPATQNTNEIFSDGIKELLAASSLQQVQPNQESPFLTSAVGGFLGAGVGSLFGSVIGTSVAQQNYYNHERQRVSGPPNSRHASKYKEANETEWTRGGSSPSRRYKDEYNNIYEANEEDDWYNKKSGPSNLHSVRCESRD